MSHCHSRLVAVRVSQDHAGLVCFSLENRSDERIEFGVYQNHVLTVMKRTQCHVRGGFDGARYLDHNVDGITCGQY